MENNKRKESFGDKTDIKQIEENSMQAKKRLIPKKGDFRMRAHVNPLKDTPFP